MSSEFIYRDAGMVECLQQGGEALMQSRHPQGEHGAVLPAIDHPHHPATVLQAPGPIGQLELHHLFGAERGDQLAGVSPGRSPAPGPRSPLGRRAAPLLPCSGW